MLPPAAMAACRPSSGAPVTKCDVTAPAALDLPTRSLPTPSGGLGLAAGVVVHGPRVER
jgi:hypothetical protein